MRRLCDIGMNTSGVSQTLHETAIATGSKGAARSAAELADVVGGVLGQDATPAFLVATGRRVRELAPGV